VYLVTAKEMRLMEQVFTEEAGLPSAVLMESAGAAVARVVAERVAAPGRVLVLCGHGANGGDGFVAARHLAGAGYDVAVWLAGEEGRIGGDAALMWRALRGSGVEVVVWDGRAEPLVDAIREADAVVDALLGTGARGTPRGRVGAALSVLAACRPRRGIVVSVDLPSGVNADTGEAPPEAVRADVTVTFGAPKWGHFLFPAAALRGDLVVSDIGIPPALAERIGVAARIITRDVARVGWPPRPRFSHKGSHGHVLVVGGSRSMPGAAQLAALAALRSGAGLVTLAVPASAAPYVTGRDPEILVWAWPDEDGHFAPDSWRCLEEGPRRYTVLAVGPGVGRWPGGETWLAHLLLGFPGPVVVDADALAFLAKSRHLLRRRAAPTIVTPHPREMGRLLGREETVAEAARPETARAFAREHHVYVVLKGAYSLVACPDGQLYLNPTGSSALAKGGSGDVLTGVVAGLVAQTADVRAALLTGVWLHGRAGERAGDPVPHAPLARDVIARLPEAMAELAVEGSAIRQTYFPGN